MLIGGGGADSRPSDNAVGETNVEVGRILLPSWQLKLDVPSFSPFCAAIVPHPSPPHPPEGEHAALESGENGSESRRKWLIDPSSQEPDREKGPELAALRGEMSTAGRCVVHIASAVDDMAAGRDGPKRS